MNLRNKAIWFVICMLCFFTLPGCPPPARPSGAISSSSPIVGRWEGSITLEDDTIKENIDLVFGPTSLVKVGMFGEESWVTWVYLYEDDFSLDHASYSFKDGVASVDDALFTSDVVFGEMTATLTLSEDETMLTGPMSYTYGGDPVSGTYSATKEE